MSYPKPLSEKTLARKYAKSGLTAKQQEFLHAFFDAAVNLYGAVPIRHLWEIYKDLSKKTDTPLIHKKDIVAFSGIARRENHSYYVFEQDDLYTADENKPSKPLDRELVAKEVMGIGYGKRMPYYSLTDVQDDKPYFIPDDFLSYAVIRPSEEEKKLKSFLGNLKAEVSEPEDRCGNKKESDHVGKKLNEFSFLSRHEEFEAKYIGGETKDGLKRNEKLLNEFLEDRKGPESEKIFRDIRRRSMLGSSSPMDEIKYITEELNECGVFLSEKDLNKLLQLFNDYHNHTHLYCNRGWTPAELSRQSIGNGPLTISLGPGIEKAIAEGKIDRTELEEKLKAMGVGIQK